MLNPITEIIRCDQGSEDWHFGRVGVITASKFHLVTERRKTGANRGGFKAEAEKYAFQLAMERITGKPLDDTYLTPQMKRGSQLEEEARTLHEIRIDTLIEQVGLIRTVDGKYGASPDGFINDDGGSEYKCFVAPDRIMPILIHGDTSEIKPQMQGGMWLSRRSWWHFGLYCPALAAVGKELTIIPEERDDTYIEELAFNLNEFDALVEEYRARILEADVCDYRIPEPSFTPAAPEPSAFGIFGVM